jgi:predicted GNAT family acetyltransferase
MNVLSLVTDNVAEQRFELSTGAGVAFSEYALRGDVLEVRHTEVPPELEGQGIGSQLARGVLEHARARGLQVLPRCPFVAAYMRRHPEFDDLRA